MRAIILAAGMGTRLGALTHDTPKCMMVLRGKTLLERQIDNYRAQGVTDIVVIRGYLAERIQYEGVTYVENPDYAKTGLLGSLMCAAAYMDEGFFFSYADTTWRAQHVGAVRAGLPEGGMAVAVDLDWALAYEGRDQHPVTEAECVALDAHGQIVKGGKLVTPEEALGEVAGLGALSPEAARKLRAAYEALEAQGPSLVFGQKGSLRHAYVIDLMLHLARTQGVPFVPALVRGGWREIDTPQDLDNAQRDVDW
jgi:choline kinase